MLHDEVAARFGHEGRQAREQIERLEHEVGRAVVPFAFQLEEHATILEERQALLRHRRTQQVATEAFETIAVIASDGDGGVEVETVHVRLQRRLRSDAA
jgi:hypothetical protein